MDERIDPEMRAAKKRMDDAAAAMPPLSMLPPLDASRAISDQLQLPWAEGGPLMHGTEERWVFAQGRRVLCRLHRPNADPDLPVLVWFHGGGWVWSSIDTHDRLVRELAASGQVATINVDYSLAPEAKFPRAVLECADAVRQIALHAREWGLDPGRIAVGGDSAGGTLALATALLLRDTNGPQLRALLAVYPVTDAGCDTLTYQEFAEGYGLTRAAMQAYWGQYLRDEADRFNPLASPLCADATDLPSSYVIVAELDVLRDEGIAMAEKMKAAGVEVTLDICPGVLHGFMRLTGAVGVARDAALRAGAWLQRTLG
jgi:acetyl esterase